MSRIHHLTEEPHADGPLSAGDVVARPSLVDASATILPRSTRHLAVGLLATLATVFFLSWAQNFLVPLLLGIVISYTLTPLVTWLDSHRIPRLAGTIIVMTGVIGMVALGAYALRSQAQTIIDQVPQAANTFAEKLTRLRFSQVGNFQTVQDAASKVEEATTQSADPSPAPRQSTTHVIVDSPKFKLGDFLWQGSMGALGAIAQAATVAFLVFFLLLGGDTFKRKLVRIAGPTLTKRKVAVHVLDDINRSIQKYMLMLLTTNLLVGLLSWIAFRWIGLENAGAWAAAAGLLHIVPYLGPSITAGVAGMAAFVQFDSFGKALLVAGASLAIATAVGTFVVTWMTGRIASMNAAAVFISLLFWGWLWGVWGMLLSVPLIVILKVLSQQVEQFHPLAELLGD
jgi:predicted PurR-regulated permease PerM